MNWLKAENITAVATCVSAIAAIFALISLWLIRAQIKADHDRSRRERAADLMVCFVESQDPTNHEVVYAIELLYQLTPEQSTSLHSREIFSVTEKQQPLLDLYRGAFYSSIKKPQLPDGKQHILTLGEVLALRKTATVSLNHLELLASAWVHHIADRSILEQEFTAVFCPRPGVYVLETYRNASGIYPSIASLCEHYRKIKEQQRAKREPTGV